VPSFSVKQLARDPEPFGHYRYEIYRGYVRVARYWHDHRGEEHGIEFLDGTREAWPVGRMIDFLQGGGPEPLRLSPAAVAWLEQRLRGA
jgi:hypothetical protein